MMPDDYSSPLPKRRKLANRPDEVTTTKLAEPTPSTCKSLERAVSPPLCRRISRAPISLVLAEGDSVAKPTVDPAPSKSTSTSTSPECREREEAMQEKSREEQAQAKIIGSPIQLSRIRDLAPWQNGDAVGLGELLGDVMIRECWCFNFLFDLPFIMEQFDADVRDVVKVKIVHGFWKRDDERRIALMETAERYPNVQVLSAYIPDPFGTHHSKMLILFRHDDLAQIVIHTANMIPKDWTNMTQAVWRSPLLPLLPQPSTPRLTSTSYPIGSGERFKVDLLRYLDKYEKRLSGLTKQLADYSFSAVRAAFIGSVPSRQKPSLAQPEKHTSFGWLGVQEILSSIPVLRKERAPHIVIQVSSIATLGAAPTWLKNFQSVLSRHGNAQNTSEARSAKTLTKTSTEIATETSTSLIKHPSVENSLDATFNVIFPTPEEIRTSLDGYESGGSIHMRLQSAQQQKQLEYLKPLFCHWKHLSTTTPSSSGCSQNGGPSCINRALRGPAAPHIKTYIRFSDNEHKTIDWAMLTSANLSKQAWGDVVNKKGEVWVQSWETGVVVWPALFAEDAVIVPVCGQDMPEHQNVNVAELMGEARSSNKSRTVVGFRMPYDLPLSSYRKDDMPWCATMQYHDLDWKGRGWGGW